MPPNSSSAAVNATNLKDNEITPIEIPSKNKLRWYEPETKILWVNVIFIVTLHVISLYYFITFPYTEHKFLLVWTWITAYIHGFGIVAGAHRLWAHRSYKAKLPLRIILALCFFSTGQNSIFNWVRDHRVHHKYTDTEADPHNSHRGFWFSHVGWLMIKKKDEVRQRGRGIDMTDILEDPVVQFFDRYFSIINPILSFVVPVFIPVYFLNQSLKWTIVTQIFMRYPWLLNITWSVNSFAHLFGYHAYDKSIRPTQNIFVSFVTGGEGWHNYHHVFPWDYKANEFKSFWFNPTSLWLDVFHKLGLVYDLRRATPDHIEKLAKRKGDGTRHSQQEFSQKAVDCSY
ncbi:hypothetical protein PV327_000207 [Microctonus hyperodae]|uniref:Fatty acid desaturase domain-containing protein n=1 Tax=Microctonus hyperodae TaxID=165561 RepID=A0AA39L1X4_MICHY|nr:hypothetical protein PV327_000207 [Microctonus hyperodae]